MPALSSRHHVVEEATWKQVCEASPEVVVLPWGATEAHNLHLPYGTDTIATRHIAAEAAGLAGASGAGVAVLPVVPFGVNTGQLDIPLCLNMNPSTQAALLRDLTQSVERAGVRKLVILNGHGGNDFKQMIRELQPATRVFLCTINWYAILEARQFFDDPGDHAGELETSVMLAIAPGLVRPLGEAGPGKSRRLRLRGLREGWAWAPRQWSRVTDDTGVGDPRAASVEKGVRFIAAVVQELAAFLAELAAADPESLYE